MSDMSDKFRVELKLMKNLKVFIEMNPLKKSTVNSELAVFFILHKGGEL